MSSYGVYPLEKKCSLHSVFVEQPPNLWSRPSAVRQYSLCESEAPIAVQQTDHSHRSHKDMPSPQCWERPNI